MDNMSRRERFTNKKYKYDLEIVPTELTTKVEVDLGDGYCLTKVENITKECYYSTNEARILRAIEEQAPHILCAANYTSVCGMDLNRVIYHIQNPPELNQQMFEKEYICEPCSS